MVTPEVPRSIEGSSILVWLHQADEWVGQSSGPDGYLGRAGRMRRLVLLDTLLVRDVTKMCFFQILRKTPPTWKYL